MTTCKIGWWNTGYSPPTLSAIKKKKRTKVEVLSIIKALFLDRNIDMLGLCEISLDFFEDNDVADFLKSYNLEYDYFGRGEGRIVWNIALIYSSNAIKNIRQYIVGEELDSVPHKRLAIKWEIQIYGRDVNVYLSHFPSMHLEAAEKSKMLNKIVASMIDDPGGAPAIAMGDFNIQLFEQDFHTSIARYRNTKPHQVYSPFWQRCGELYGQDKLRQISGTYYDNNKKAWKMLDYIFYTREFSNIDSDLYSDETNFGILDEILDSKQIKKDHLPIYVTLKEK